MLTKTTLETTMSLKTKVSQDVFLAFYAEWSRDPGEQRLGQAFLNRFFVRVSDSQVFYETNPAVAYALIVERYVWQPQITPGST